MATNWLRLRLARESWSRQTRLVTGHVWLPEPLSAFVFAARKKSRSIDIPGGLYFHILGLSAYDRPF